jgi:hypothetical protein
MEVDAHYLAKFYPYTQTPKSREYVPHIGKETW